MKALKIAVGVIAAAALAACGSSGGSSASAIGKTTPVDSSIKLTLTQLDNPAHGSGAKNKPPSGNRFVSIRFQISNSTSQSQGLGADDLAVVGADGEIYPSFNSEAVSVTGCASFNDTDYIDGGLQWSVGSRATVSACTVFELPLGVKVARVIFAFSGQFTPLDATTLLWTISHSLKAVPEDLVRGTLELVRSRPVRGVYASRNAKPSSGTVQIYRANEGNGSNVAGNVYDATISVGSSGHFTLSLPPGIWQANATLFAYLQGPNGVGTGVVGGGSFLVRSGQANVIVIQLNHAHPELDRIVEASR